MHLGYGKCHRSVAMYIFPNDACSLRMHGGLAIAQLRIVKCDNHLFGPIVHMWKAFSRLHVWFFNYSYAVYVL